MWEKLLQILLLLVLTAHQINSFASSTHPSVESVEWNSDNDFHTLDQKNNEIDHQPIIGVSYDDGESIESIENTQNALYRIYQVLPEKTVTVCCHVSADSSTNLQINWFKRTIPIQFGTDSNYYKINNTCFRILGTKFQKHSDEYSCKVSQMNVEVLFVLYVKNVPQKPVIKGVECNEKEALISWYSPPVVNITVGQFRFPYDCNYTVECKLSLNNTDEETNEWTVCETEIDFNQERSPNHRVLMKPWSKYSFRVFAYNDMGVSIPNEFTDTCTSPPDIPDKNPSVTKVCGTKPTNLVIYWTPMPLTEHNGPGFYYRVHWKQSVLDDEDWNIENVTNWMQDHLTVEDQPTFVAFRAKVEAANEIGLTNASATEIHGYSGEGPPTEAPTNFDLNETENTTVILHWTPVSHKNIHGIAKGYIIHTWNDIDGEEKKNEILLTDLTISQTNVDFRSESTNYAQIYACNSQYDGPKSNIEYKMPRRISCPIPSFQAFTLSSRAFLIRWDIPLNDSVTGYKISLEESDGNVLSYRKLPKIDDPEINQMKVVDLKAQTKYRLHILATTDSGEGERHTIEAKTKSTESIKPDQPSFGWKLLDSSNSTDSVMIKVIWMPNLDGIPGANFFVKYHKIGDVKWIKTDYIKDDDFVIIPELPLNEVYAFRVVSVDGDHATESQIFEISTRINELPSDSPTIYVVPVMMLIVIVVISIALYTLREQRIAKHKEEINRLNVLSNVCPIILNEYLPNFENGDKDKIDPKLSLDEQADLLPYDRKYEISRARLKFGRQLGAGTFGVVLEATAKRILPDEDETTVAVKTIQRLADIETLRTSTMELKVLIHLGKHLNVVNLLGAVTTNISKNELMTIVEYCPHGNLRNFLIKNRSNFIDQIVDDTFVLNGNDIYESTPLDRPIASTDLLCWALQTANGMDYLASRKVLHGDLAARNILLCDGNIVKICDFGLARTMYKSGLYHTKTQRPLPYKWLALESISDQVFTTYSDVWAFGIVLWELFSLGASPYSDMTVGAHLYNKIKEGFRLEKPEYATEELYNIMVSCWRVRPDSRPLFNDLAGRFSKILGSEFTDRYLSLNEPNLKANEKHFKENFDYVSLLSSDDSESPSQPDSSSSNC